jgi:purine-binding chemotaxis protein CheW
MEASVMTSEIADGPIEALTFDLQGETFALEAGLVQEVLDLLPETDVPGAPPFVGAVINFRGRIIPLVDLRLAFDMTAGAPTIDSRIVVIEHDLDGESTLIGLRADKVHEVTTITRDVTEQPPRVGMSWRADFIRLLARRGGDVIVIPDLDQIFAARGRTTATVTPFSAIQS